jgi:predicted nucleic acid-binding protein
MVDATVLFAATLWPRWPYEVLRHARQSDVRLVLVPLVIEQARRQFARRFPAHLADFEALLRLTPYEEAADPTPEAVARHLALVRDPTDVPVALAAIDAGVDYLVSEDKDLTASDATTARLRARLQVRLTGTFLREVMGWSSDALEQVRGRTWRDFTGE